LYGQKIYAKINTFLTDKKDESSADFEDSYFPWQFKDANWGSGGRARNRD
jgi:hypothetical protein